MIGAEMKNVLKITDKNVLNNNNIFGFNKDDNNRLNIFNNNLISIEFDLNENDSSENLPFEENILADNYNIEKILSLKKDNKNNYKSLLQKHSINKKINFKLRNNKDENLNNQNLLNKKRKLMNKEKNEVLNSKNPKMQNLKLTEKRILKNNGKMTTKFGRKNKSEKGVRPHNKNSTDNIIIKIKGMIFNFIRVLIKKLSNNEYNLKKFNYGFYRNIKKDKNEKLFEEKFEDIFKNQPISSKYTATKPDENKRILEKINSSEEKNKILINILGLTFEEGLVLFRRKLALKKDKLKIKEILNKIGIVHIDDIKKLQDAEYCIEFLRKYYKDKDDKYKEYINNFKSSLENFKYLFVKKVGRNSKKPLKIKIEN